MILHNIKNFVSPLQATANFSKKIELMQQIENWKQNNNVKISYLDTKRKSYQTALKQFVKLYQVNQYYIQCPDQTPQWKDDSIKILYTTK
jgi:hypothetical protein